MNPLVKKEIRLLLPGFLASLLMTLAQWLLPEDWEAQAVLARILHIFWFFSCPAVLAMMTLGTFGREFSSGTFSMLLAQPVSRRRIWRTKTLVLAAALFIGGILWCTILYFRFEVFHHPKVLGHFSDILLGTWLFLMVIYSGALWTVLLLRQMAAAFWFTLLTPVAILGIITGLWPEKYYAACEPVVIEVMLIYSLIGFWFARRLFLQAQDVAWTGGNIALPELRGLARFKLGSSNRRLWRPRAALQAKEFQLHQSLFVLVGALALLHLGAIAARKFGHFQRNSAMEFILEIFWGLWLVMPMLAGCAAAAEERKLGTLEGQLCLPVRRRTQFVVKAGGVLLLSLLFGVAAPLLLEGTRILPDVHFKFNPVIAIAGLQGVMGWHLQMSTAQIFCSNCVEQINQWLPLLTLAGMAMAIGAISFYASTLTRNTLQALAPAMLGLMLTWFLLLVIGGRTGFPIHLPWRGWLIYFIGVPVLSATLAALAYWNFKRVFLGWQVWRRNLLVLLAMLGLVAVATTAIYHRAWEKLTPFEPPHGVARLSLSNPATLREQWSTLFVRLPDGRIWTDDYTLNAIAPNPLALVLGDVNLTHLGGGQFLEGSNWVNVVRGIRNELAGIKTDGTLWVSEKPAHRERLASGGWKMTKAGDLVRFGSETNWSSIVPHGLSMLLVKNDRTLWCWGVLTNWNWKTEWPGLQSFTPYRLGTESNWAEVYLADNQPCLRKTDGSTWTPWIGHRDDEKQRIQLEPGFSVARASFFQHSQWRSTTTTRIGLEYRLGVRDDGTFRIWADQKLKKNKNANTYELILTEVDLQIGKDTNWLAVAGYGGGIVTLKDDGSLWLWNFYHDNRYGWFAERDEREMLGKEPVRLGTHADWIAITSADGCIISLAADGSLWYWPLERLDYFEHVYNYGNGDGSHFEPLLDISRKPQFLGNVFGKPD